MTTLNLKHPDFRSTKSMVAVAHLENGCGWIVYAVECMFGCQYKCLSVIFCQADAKVSF